MCLEASNLNKNKRTRSPTPDYVCQEFSDEEYIKGNKSIRRQDVKSID